MNDRNPQLQCMLIIESDGFTSEDEQEVLDQVKELGEIISVEKNGTYCNFLFNLIDSPGHVDFSTEVTAALSQTYIQHQVYNPQAALGLGAVRFDNRPAEQAQLPVEHNIKRVFETTRDVKFTRGTQIRSKGNKQNAR